MLSDARVALHAWIAERVLARNDPCERFFASEALPLARACKEMATRFLRGGRLLAFGRGAYATDAMHVSVEFIHPVIVGKRALPALDVSMAYEAWIDSLCRENDMVAAFGPPHGEPSAPAVLHRAKMRGAMTLALPGTDADYAAASPSTDAHIHQELFELLGHTMYESVHVFLEHDSDACHGSQGSSADFLYPFLAPQQDTPDAILEDVAASILAKSRDAVALRERIAEDAVGCHRTGCGRHRRASGSRRANPGLRQRRIGYRCNGLRTRLRDAGARVDADSRDLARSRTGRDYRNRE